MGTSGTEDFGDTKDLFEHKDEFDGNMFGDGDKICSTSPLEDGLLTDPDCCGMCGDKLVEPRVMSCLHVFCGSCLDKKLIGEGGDSGTPDMSITCPTCNQDTKVGVKKLASLPLDVMKINVSDVSHVTSLSCTCCTAKETAISRCSTCHNLLCGNCDSAHRYMRCFEAHKVISLDELRKNGKKITVHKPLVCESHPGENIIYYCNICNVSACSECAKNEHKGHQCESILDSELRVRQELESMLADSKTEVDLLIKTSTELANSLEELGHQHTVAKDLINESYQSYKAVLEKCRDSAFEELNELFHERELKVMDMSDRVGKAIDMFEDACKYATSLLENGTVPEIMYLRQVVFARLKNLISNTPKPETTYSVEFQTDFKEFEKVIKKVFGSFRTESTIVASPKGNSPQSFATSLASVSVNGHAPLTNGCARSLTNGSPISMTGSVQSSFEGEVNTNLPSFNIAHSPPVPPANLQGFTSMAEYNIAQLATLAENNASTATSPTPAFSIADLLTSDTAYKNLASLAKLGLNADPLNSLVNPSGPNVGSVIPRTNKVSPMQIRCKFGQLGPSKGQFNSPHGFCLGLEEDIIVADTNNHRIQVFEKTGTFKFQFGIPGKDEGQLWYPRKVAVMRSTGKYVVCDRGNERSRMQIFTKNGHFLKKIAIRYIDIVAGLAVTAHGEIVAVDSVSPTVFVISETGDLLRWFDCSDYMREPSDIAIHGKEFYVCDFKGHNVVVFNEDGTFIRRIGCESLTNFPNGIDISDAGDILIGDSHGNRFHVAVFSKEGGLVSEFECPYVKVSRCCGLKITSEGYVVTLAKNNHHVLVLNTLYIL